MHFLTKFLVVVAAVLSILLAGLSVGLAYNAEAATSNFAEVRSALDAAESQVSQRESRALVELQTMEDQLEAMSQERAAAMREVARVTSELDRINQELIETRRRAQTFEAELSGFRALLESQQEIDEARAEELRALRESEIDYAMREIQLADQINELSSQLEVAQETNRSLLEENTRLQERVDVLATSGGRVGDERTAVRRAPRDFRGRVTNVRENPAGGFLVGLNAGSQDNLDERMKLAVVRDNEFIATIIVRSVNLNDAVAAVDVLEPGAEVRTGDTVIAAN